MLNIFFAKYITIYNLLNTIQNLNKNSDYNISHHKSDNDIVLIYIITYFLMYNILITFLFICSWCALLLIIHGLKNKKNIFWKNSIKFYCKLRILSFIVINRNIFLSLCYIYHNYWLWDYYIVSLNNIYNNIVYDYEFQIKKKYLFNKFSFVQI